MLELHDHGILRSSDRVWCLPGGDAERRAVVLGGTQRYYRIPPAAKDFLHDLATFPAGRTVAEAREHHPLVDLRRLHALGLVDYVPPEGIPPRGRLVAEMWAHNVWAQTLLRTLGWSAVAEKMTGHDHYGPSARPLLFDDLEAATRRSFALPVTSKQCTTVSLSLWAALRNRGYAPRIAVLGTHDASLFHAVAMVGQHVIDPADTLIEAEEFVPLENLS